MSMPIICVYLLEEGVDAWRPVDAEIERMEGNDAVGLVVRVLRGILIGA